MTAGTWKRYAIFANDLDNGKHDFTGGVYRMALFLSTSNADNDARAVYADLTNEVANGLGYTTGGATVAITVTQSGSASLIKPDHAAWTIAGGTIYPLTAVFYRDGTVGATVKPLVARLPLDSGGGSVMITPGNLLVGVPTGSALATVG